VTSAGVRFAMVMVPNVGDQNRAWWWYVGIKVDDIESTLSEHNARLVSLRSYAYSGEQLFAIIMISNYGLDYKQWSWYAQISSDQISSNISTGYAGQRLTSFSPNPFSGWDVIFVESEGEQWWWDYDLDGTQVGQSINSHNSRLIDISTYAVNGNLKFAIVELDNSNLPQSPINAESTAVRTQAETGGWSGGYHGSYFVESSASPSPIVRREIGKLRDKTKFSENQKPKPHHEGAHARPRDAYLLEIHACKIRACEIHTYEGIRP
jgi:hypothetical protein